LQRTAGPYRSANNRHRGTASIADGADIYRAGPKANI
jgi:hypothetical protein